MASDPPHCEYCGTFATQKCTGCKLVFYCGKEHQILDWKKEHKSKCKAYEVLQFKLQHLNDFTHHGCCLFFFRVHCV